MRFFQNSVWENDFPVSVQNQSRKHFLLDSERIKIRNKRKDDIKCLRLGKR